jgi:hypothetical protein
MMLSACFNEHANDNSEESRNLRHGLLTRGPHNGKLSDADAAKRSRH